MCVCVGGGGMSSVCNGYQPPLRISFASLIEIYSAFLHVPIHLQSKDAVFYNHRLYLV